MATAAVGVEEAGAATVAAALVAVTTAVARVGDAAVAVLL